MPSELRRSRVVIAAAIKIAYLAKESNSSNALTLKAWLATLCALIIEILSVIAACIPYLKPYLDSLESGMMNNDQLRQEGISGLYSRGKSKATGSSSHQPKKASYDVSGSSKTREYLHLGSFSYIKPDEDAGVFWGPNLPSQSIRTAREVMMAA